MFFKRLSDVWDEEYKVILEAENDVDEAKHRLNHRFQIPEDCHWDDVRKVSENVGAALQNAFNKIEAANQEHKFTDIFGDAQWTNKRRFSDELLQKLMEHFSQINFALTNVPHDMMGLGYEYLIGKFADDGGHTAAEFYTNATVAQLMCQLTDVQPRESVYDPTCGSGGLLIGAIMHLKGQGKEFRNVKLYGQEKNLITSSIARINLFVHSIDDFDIVQGDTLDQPATFGGDELKQFDVIMANPPYSLKNWNQNKWTTDPWGRNIWGTPPQGCADYAFQQHIVRSLNPKNGRSIVLWPHGVLDRSGGEADLRRKMIEEDSIEAVIGLGRKLFYNSGMESCLLISRKNKPKERKGKILFINAINEITTKRAAAYLETSHIDLINKTYQGFEEIKHFSKIVENDYILKEFNGNLNIPLYVQPALKGKTENTIEEVVEEIKKKQSEINDNLINLVNNIQQIDKIKQSKADWTKIELQDVCEEYASRINDPSSSQTSIFVGSENIKQNDFTVKEWGNTNDVSSSMKTFKKGDYLLVKRSLYGSDFRERAALAQLDGVCSADILTLREKSDKITKGYLWSVLNSSNIWSYIIANASGSITRRVKWEQLKKYPFKLPPIIVQKRMVGLFNCLDKQMEESQKQLDTLEILKKKLIREIL